MNNSSQKCCNESCSRESIPNDDFCILHSSQKDKNLNMFTNELNKHIKLANEQKGIDLLIFEDFVFPPNYRFNKVEFQKDLIISNISVFEEFSFHRCTFHGELFFKHSELNGTVKFSKCNFNKLFRINHINFLGENDLIFRDNHFQSHFQIFKCISNQAVVFYFDEFKGEFRLSDSNAKDGWHFLVIDFNQAKRVRIHNIDFSNVYFWSSKILNVDFYEIKWRKKGARYIIGDELLALQKSNPKHKLRDKPRLIDVENLYMQLVNNFERNGLFAESSKFYISAMEMRRKSKNNWFTKNLFSIEAWYKYASLYGQSTNRALLCLLTVFLLSSFFLYLNSSLPTSTVNKQLFLSISSIAEYLYNSFYFIKANFILLVNPPDLTFEQISTQYFIVSFERIIIFILTTLYILALRRRFKRS